MTHLRASLIVPALLSSLALVACGSSSTKGGGGTSGGSGGKSGLGGTSGSAGGTTGGVPRSVACAGSSAATGTTCTQAELDAYSSCFTTACDATFQMCYGPGFKSGQFSGPCGTYEACTSKCACTDSACVSACGTQPADCTSCLVGGLLTCSASCTRPACFSSGLGGASGSGLGGRFGGFGGTFGGFGGTVGGLGLGGTAGSGTCLADALACCNRASATDKSACMTGYQALVSLGEQLCAGGLAQFESSFCP